MSFRPVSRADSAASSTSEPLPFAQRIAPSSHEQNAVFAEKRAKMLSPGTEELLADIGPVRFPPSSSADTALLTVLGLGNSKAIASSTGDIETHLLIAKLEDTKQHLARLRGRIEDTRSRVLVTGDLNGGKSTFVNALLRRTVVPSDQQPCTALFCEVVDAIQNNNIEEVHGIVNAALYNQNDPSTYTAFKIDILRDVVEDNEPGYEMLKVYCHDARNGKEDSVLHNGIVDISLIDSPGLNIDSMKTTNLMAQQEEIDVIGREFLQNAGKEKAFVFVVVNRFDQIRRTDRCKRDILKQISEISPGTYQHADQLVHFVAAKKILENTADAASRADFTCLEDNLRSFILEKRARSKLNPAKLFLGNLLNDLAILCSYNHTLSAVKSVEISNTLSESAPAYDRMLRIKEQFLDDLDRTIDETASRSQAFARDQLSTFLEGVETYVEDIEWGGVLGMWQYARDLRNAVYRMAAVRLRRCEDFAVKSSVGCVKNIEAMAESCIEKPPTVNMDVVTTAFEDGSAEAGRAAAMSMFVPLELGDFFDVMVC
ncbi:UNVERIFIED_CONTAM: mitofusin [Siphonaria sp. JEL0065]|nr:mitofusin [Siphonaria sp. JEL0065]